MIYIRRDKVNTGYMASAYGARRVQKVGYNTLSLSLPREWVVKRGIRQGDVLTIKEGEDGSLVVEPPGSRQPSLLKCSVNMDACSSKGMLSRLVTGCYVLGYDTIRVSSSGEIDAEKAREVRLTVDKLPGLEVVEQTMKRVILQSFVDASKFPIEGLLRRLQVMVTSMLNTTIEALVEGKPSRAREALRLEEEVDRLYALVVRQILAGLMDKQVAISVGADSPLYLSGARLVAKFLEEMGDLIVKLSEEVIKLGSSRNRVAEIMAEFRRFGIDIQMLIGRSMKALFQVNIELANDVIQASDAISDHRRMLEEQIMSKVEDAKVAASLRSMVWSLEYIARYCKNVAEVTFNRFLRKPESKLVLVEGSRLP